MKAIRGIFLVSALIWCFIWFSTPTSRLRHRSIRGRKGGGNKGNGFDVGVRNINKWDWWPTFDQEVTDNELLELFDGFLVRRLTALYKVLRGGQVQFGVTRAETVAEHVLDLEKLDEQYASNRNFSFRQKLTLLVMHREHDIVEGEMKKDSPIFPEVPQDLEERRKFVLEWQPPTREEEHKRWIAEWRCERELLRVEIIGLSERKQKILLYLFDWFNLGQDDLALLARELHYLQPVLSIWRKTGSWYARLMHYKRALAILTDRLVIKHLLRSCRMEG